MQHNLPLFFHELTWNSVITHPKSGLQVCRCSLRCSHHLKRVIEKRLRIEKNKIHSGFLCQYIV